MIQIAKSCTKNPSKKPKSSQILPQNALEDNKSINLSMRRCQFFIQATKKKSIQFSAHRLQYSTRNLITFTRLLRREITFVRSTMTFIIIIYYYFVYLNRSHENGKMCANLQYFFLFFWPNVCLYISVRLHSQLSSSCSTLNGRSRLFFFIVDDKKNIRDSEWICEDEPRHCQKNIYTHSLTVPVCMKKKRFFFCFGRKEKHFVNCEKKELKIKKCSQIQLHTSQQNK